MMPSAMLATAIGSPTYQSALKDAGFDTSDTVYYQGKTYTHDDIAAMVDDSYRRLRPQFAVGIGGKPRMQRKQEKKFRKAVMGDVGSQFQMSWMTIIAAVVLFIFTGPFGLAMGIASALFSHYLELDLKENPQMLAAMGAT